MRGILTHILTLLIATHLTACDAGRGGVNVGNGKKDESNPSGNESSWSFVETEEANKICRKDFPSYHPTVSKPELPRICECIIKVVAKVAVYEDYQTNPTSFWQALHLNGQLAQCMPGSDIATSPPNDARKWVKATPIEEESGLVSAPLLLRDRTGREAAIWIQKIVGKDFSIKVRRMQANGWASISSVASIPTINAAFAAQVKKNNAIAIVWTNGSSVFAGELPDGASSITAQKLNDDTIGVQDVAIAVDSDDQVRIVWQEATPNPSADFPYRLMYRHYDGTKWTDPYELISGDVRRPKVTSKGKEVLVVWEHREAEITGIGATSFSNGAWTTKKMIDNAGINKWKSTDPIIAASNDYAHVVFYSTENTTAKLNVRSFSWASKGWLDLTTIYSGPIVLKPSVATHNDNDAYVTWMTRGGSGITVMNASWRLSENTWPASPVAVFLDSDSLVQPRVSINNKGDKLLTYGIRKGAKSIAYAQIETGKIWGTSEMMVETSEKIYEIFANLHDDATAIGLWLELNDLHYNKRE